MRRAREVLDHLAQPRGGVVGVAGERAVAPRQAGAPAEIVIAVDRQHSDARGRALLADRGDLAGDEIIVIDMIGGRPRGIDRPGQPGAAARKVVLACEDGVGDQRDRDGLRELPPEAIPRGRYLIRLGPMRGRSGTTMREPAMRQPRAAGARRRIGIVSPEFSMG